MKKLAILFTVMATMPLLAQNSSCPLEIDSLKLSHSIMGIGTSTGQAVKWGTLSFKYNNVSGKDIQSITLRAEGRKQASGPTGPSSLDMSRAVDVNGPIPANSSKKLSVRLPDGSWYSFELEAVKFSNGDTWRNEGKAECVVNATNRVRH